MLIKLSRKINNATVNFEVDEREAERALELVAFLATDDYCNSCKTADKIKWTANRAKGKEDGKEYIYIKRHCWNCGADSTMGKYLSGGLFWKAFEVFNKENGTTTATADKNVVATPQNASDKAPHPADTDTMPWE